MNFLTLAAEYWTEAAFGLIIAALGLGYRHLSRRISEQDAIKNGIQALLRDRLIQAYNQYSERGYCPIFARDNALNMFRQYSALGGNGTVSALMEKIEELPTDPPPKRKKKSDP